MPGLSSGRNQRQSSERSPPRYPPAPFLTPDTALQLVSEGVKPAHTRLVVLADSLSFHGPDGPVPLADPRLYPNRLASRLSAVGGMDWEVQVVARAGWCLRDVWLALQKDVHLQQQVVMGAGAVVLGVGSSDPLPVGLPRSVTAVVPFVRPAPLRRRLRRAIDRAHPHLVRATGGRLLYTPPDVYEHCWRKSIGGLRLFAPDAALCAILPAIHMGPYYAADNRHRDRFATLTRDLARELDVPVVDLAPLCARWLSKFNADGLHWPWEVHAEVAAAMAAALGPGVASARVAPGRSPAQPPSPSATGAPATLPPGM